MKVVVFGGGNGLSNLLRELKNEDLDICAVVCVSDDGGSSGILRNSLNMIPPGDIRRVLCSLSFDESFEKLFNYRFDHYFKGHTVGNIILAALYKMNNSFSKAIDELSNMLKIKGKVMPVSYDDVTLLATFIDNTVRLGESKIVFENKKIKELEVLGAPVVNVDVLKELELCDAVIFSQGSLYTSLISNMLFKDIRDKINMIKAKKIYVVNVFTELGETEDYTVKDHINALEKYVHVDKVIFNNNINIDNKILDLYLPNKLVIPDILGGYNLIKVSDKIEYDTKYLVKIIMEELK